MQSHELPKMNMEVPEGGCCPKFDPAPWEATEQVVFNEKLFVQFNTINFLHIPLNMKGVMMKAWEKVQEAEADTKDHYLLLSHDPSPWKSEHFMAVTKEVEGFPAVRLSGTYLIKVFEGPYKNAATWCKEMKALVKEKGKTLKKLYFFYTTCPKCAKHWGKNYVIGFAEV